MPPPADRPLRKVTLNLFADDVAQLERRYGRGWTEQVRRVVEENCDRYRHFQAQLEPADGK